MYTSNFAEILSFQRPIMLDEFPEIPTNVNEPNAVIDCLPHGETPFDFPLDHTGSLFVNYKGKHIATIEVVKVNKAVSVQIRVWDENKKGLNNTLYTAMCPAKGVGSIRSFNINGFLGMIEIFREEPQW